MVQKSYTAVSHPNAVMVHSHYATVTAHTAVLCARRHDLTARLTPGEFANLRHLSRIILDLLLLQCTLRAHFQKLDVIIVRSNHESTRRLFLRHLNVSHHCPIEAFKEVLLTLQSAELQHSLQLLWMDKLRLQFVNKLLSYFSRMSDKSLKHRNEGKPEYCAQEH